MENDNSAQDNYNVKNSIDCFRQAIRTSNYGGFRASNQNFKYENIREAFDGHRSKMENQFLNSSNNSLLQVKQGYSNNNNLISGNNNFNYNNHYGYNSNSSLNSELRGSGSMAFKAEANLLNFSTNNNDYFLSDMNNQIIGITRSEMNHNSQIPTQIQEETEFITIKQINTDEYNYIGETEFNERTGFGICTYSNGSKYEGEWKYNKQNGLGRLTLINGSIYKGEFKNNRPDGYVEYSDNNGFVIKGMMKNFSYLSETPIIINNTRTLQKFEICPFNNIDTQAFASDLVNGFGKIINKDNSIYQGNIKQSYQNGLGIFVKDNVVFIGNKINRAYNGYCEIIYRDGTQFFGCFKNNKKEGLGLFLSKDNLLNLANYKENIKNGASITRKYDSAINSEVFAYENFHYGFRSNKLETRELIDKYLSNFYPEQHALINLDYKKLIQILEN